MEISDYYKLDDKRLKIRCVRVGEFSAEIAKWKYDQYYCLSLMTTPRSRHINTEKQFKTKEAAQAYYLTQLEKVLTDGLDGLKIDSK